MLIPSVEESEVIMKLAEPRHGVEILNIGRNISVDLEGHTIHGKVYKVEAE